MHAWFLAITVTDQAAKIKLTITVTDQAAKIKLIKPQALVGTSTLCHVLFHPRPIMLCSHAHEAFLIHVHNNYMLTFCTAHSLQHHFQGSYILSAVFTPCYFGQSACYDCIMLPA